MPKEGTAKVGAQGNPPPTPVIRPGNNLYAGPAFIPYAPTRDTEDRLIDKFFGDWRESMPRYEHGSLVLRDILTHGDNFDPPQKAAVLSYANWFAHGILAPHASTAPSRLERQQEVFYILGGRGEVKAGGERADLHKGSAILMPAGLEFVIRNTGDEPLTAYVINEPTPFEFRPNARMLIRDEGSAHMRIPQIPSPFDTLPGASGHWGHIVREYFGKTDGLATVQAVLTVGLNPVTMGEPHPHPPGHEEVWAAITGNSLAFVGTQLRLQRPGMAYMVRPDGTTMHANINHTDAPDSFLYFARYPRPTDRR